MVRMQYHFSNFMIVILVMKLSAAIVIPFLIGLGLVVDVTGPRVSLKSTGERSGLFPCHGDAISPRTANYVTAKRAATPYPTPATNRYKLNLTFLLTEKPMIWASL